MVFHVYVDGVTGPGPDAARELSETMSARYGLPAAELRARLSKGRFRVKANVDHVTAVAYARALEAIGARVCIEPTRAAGPSVAPPADQASGKLVSRPTRHSLPPQPGSRPTKSSLTPQLELSASIPAPELPASSPAPSAPELPASSPAPSAPELPASTPVPPPQELPVSALAPQAASRSTRSSWPPLQELSVPTSPQATSRSTRPSWPPRPASRAPAALLPPQPASRAPAALLPSQPASRAPAVLLPSQPASRAPAVLLPSQPASRTSVMQLPPQPVSRTSSSLPPQPASRPTKSSLSPPSGRQPTRSSLPPPESRSTTSSLTLHPELQSTTSSRPPHPAWQPGAESPHELALRLPPSPSSEPPGGLEAVPGGLEAVPGGLEAAPGGLEAAPGGLEAAPGGLEGAPGRLEAAPGGLEAAPGGLEAAPGGEPATQLGALEHSGLLSLASLDGVTPAGTSGALSQPVDALRASIGPAAARPAAGTARPKDQPVDRFAPPASAAAELVVELADDELAHRARKRMTASPVAAPEPSAPPPASSLSVAPGPAARGATPAPESGAAGSADPASQDARSRTPALVPSMMPAPAPAPLPSAPWRAELPAPTSWLADPRKLVASPRARFGVGVLLAIVLGFIPADLVASARERGALRAIDARVATVQAAVDSPDSYDALDGFRADQLEAKRSKRRTIALTAMMVWAAAGGVFGYVWFKRIRWDRFD